MKWVSYVVAGYAVFLFLGVGALGYLARAQHRLAFSYQNARGTYFLEGFRDAKVPFAIAGWGRSPGEVELKDADGRVIDAERLDDVLSVRDVRWGRFAVAFAYERGGRWYDGTLELEP